MSFEILDFRLQRIATIGFFDGVHKGHMFLFEHLTQLASERHLEPLIITFDTHPRAVLQSDYVPQLLTSLEEREALLSRFGEVKVLPFADICHLTAAEFMAMLHDKMGVSVLLMGYDHRFGSDRLRHPNDYHRLGEQYKIEVLTLGEFVEGELHVSSTEIRQALENGNILVANDLLGRPYTISGTVIHGNSIGRTIGFPTANVQVDDPHKALPKNGVYAVKIQVEGDSWRSAILNIGTNPTVGNQTVTIEVHILDFTGDLYGKKITLSVQRYIREEKRFDNLEQLREQITRDVDNIRRLDEPKPVIH